jgi:hypothetical protein
MKTCGIIIVIVFLVNCSTDDRRTKFKQGDFYVLADTNSLGFINGVAEFYNINNKLSKRIHL